MLLSHISYLFRLRLLSEDFHLLEGLHSADKKFHPLLPETEATLMFVYFW